MAAPSNQMLCKVHGWIDYEVPYVLPDGRCALCAAEERGFNGAARRLRAALDELALALRAVLRHR